MKGRVYLIFWGSGGGEGRGGEGFITTPTTASAPLFWIPTSYLRDYLFFFIFTPSCFFPGRASLLRQLRFLYPSLLLYETIAFSEGSPAGFGRAVDERGKDFTKLWRFSLSSYVPKRGEEIWIFLFFFFLAFFGELSRAAFGSIVYGAGKRDW